MKTAFLSSLAFASIFMPGAAMAQDDWRSVAVAALPPSGELHLQFIVADEADGFMRLGWTRNEAEGTLEFYDRTMWGAQEIYETMEGAIDAETLAPLNVSVRFHHGNTIMSVDASALDGHMVGARNMMQPNGGTQSADINVPISDGMVMRAAVFLLAQTLPLDVGESVSFDWFASMGGNAGTVSITAAEAVTIEAGATIYDTIRLELRGESPENDIFVTDTAGIRQVVRINVLGQPMHFEAFPASPEE
ncbi:MAG: hypothetical protein DHS20C06_08260 [Hyphobacterium sp.]|nr:MAG: hypothetical protein DHS20C06_08260 [Hyphobacterium sp.]